MYVITGGAGFIGSTLLRKLNDEGIEDILVVDNLAATEKWKNLSGKRFIDYVHKDRFMEWVTTNQLPYSIKSIVHLGACSSTTEKNADYLMENNYRYSFLLAKWALGNNARFIYASSAATYGNGAQGYNDQDCPLKLRPLNMYGYSKQLFDLWVLREKLNDKLVGLKFFNVYGPNEYHKGNMISVAAKAYEQIRETEKLKLFKSYREEYRDGEQKRDFVYVKDCVEVMWWLLKNTQVNGIFNVGTGEARTWNDLAKAVFQAMEREVNIEYIEMPDNIRNQYQYFTEAKMGKLKDSGYPHKFHSLEDGVKDYCQNYLAQEDRYW